MDRTLSQNRLLVNAACPAIFWTGWDNLLATTNITVAPSGRRPGLPPCPGSRGRRTPGDDPQAHGLPRAITSPCLPGAVPALVALRPATAVKSTIGSFVYSNEKAPREGRPMTERYHKIGC
jgi:hypothetical protein